MLTQRQMQLLRFIKDHLDRHDVSPSFEEMRAALELRSKSGIHRLLSGLEERGYIRRLPYRARALEIIKNADGSAMHRAIEPAAADPRVIRPAFRGHAPDRGDADAPRQGGCGVSIEGVGGHVDLPIRGRIAAGTAIEALSEYDRVVDVPAHMVGPGAHYVLEIVGDSMIEAGIHDGDLAVIKASSTAENGDIVVALIEEREVTLKRLRRRGASIALEAANPDYETRIFGPNQIRVQGRLVGLMRSY